MKIEGIAKKVAQELNISYELAETICRSQFKFILETLKKGDQAVNCIHLGKFHRNKRYKRNDRRDIQRIQESDIQE